MTDYRNHFEKRARTRKVRRICKAIREANSYGWKGHQLALFAIRLTVPQWMDVALVAGTRLPSPATIIRVVRALRVYQEVA